MPAYDTRMTPPAAFVDIQVTNPATGASQQVRAKLDTGAAGTVLPDVVVAALGLRPEGEALCYGYDRVPVWRPTYYVAIELAGYRIPIVEVVASPREDALLGRDVLNHFVITFNGKALTFELQDP